MVGGGGLVSLAGSDARDMRDCRAGFEKGVESTIPEPGPYLRSSRMRRAVDDFCAAAIERFGHVDDENAGVLVTQLMREKPHVFRGLCQAGMKAELAGMKRELAYLRPGELRTYQKDPCRLTFRYPGEGGEPLIDNNSMLREHPRLLAPFCAAGMEAEVMRDPAMRGTVDRRRLGTIARRACTEALRAGVVDASGPRGLLDPRVDDRRFERIFPRVLREHGGCAAFLRSCRFPRVLREHGGCAAFLRSCR